MKRIFVIIGLITMMAGAAWAYTEWNKYVIGIRSTQFNADVDDLFESLQKYKEHIGSYPVGSNADVVRALMGNNSKNLIIIVGRKKNLNTKGELVDPWGTPFKIYFSGEGVLVRSAGPNKRFDDSTVPNSDDYIRSN